SREVFDVDCELVQASGRRVPVSISAVVLRDRRELATGLAVMVRDLREVITLRQRLLISSRMAALGQLAAGVAHEINNPMAYVRANLGLLRSHWARLRSISDEKRFAAEREELFAEGIELIDESLEGVGRTTSIVREIKNFSHSEGQGREQTDLNALVHSVTRVVAPQLGANIRIDQNTEDLPRVFCAPREIQQVLVNLVLNAADALEGSGVIRIYTRTLGESVEICVEDDGCGIDPDTLERIFDPFFTTKGVGKGTGLGLALSYDIVHRHRGDMIVSSELGEGTRFCVTLPVDPRGADDPAKA
ncbi:MAG: ATP-binding protein, partial [Myxococcota bacterium]